MTKTWICFLISFTSGIYKKGKNKFWVKTKMMERKRMIDYFCSPMKKLIGSIERMMIGTLNKRYKIIDFNIRQKAYSLSKDYTILKNSPINFTGA